MVVLGLILLIIGLVSTLKLLFWIGLVLLILGIVGNGFAYRGGSRRYWY